VTAIGTDHRAFFYVNLFPYVLSWTPRVPRYRSPLAKLGVARARTRQTLPPLQALPPAGIRLLAVVMSELSQQAPLSKTNYRFCCVYERLPVELGHESP
jgi:hypothetical protein